jgi:hypothetical protein
VTLKRRVAASRVPSIPHAATGCRSLEFRQQLHDVGRRGASVGQGAISPAFSAIGRANRTSERKNLPGSSLIGMWAECSNQTRCFSGASIVPNHAAATSEFTFQSWRPSKRISGTASLRIVVRSSATSSGSR